MGEPHKISHAYAHLPTYCCHLVKSFLEGLIKGDLDFLEGIVFCQTCDAMQGLSDILAQQDRRLLQVNFMLPANLSTKLARPYLKRELEHFKKVLESRQGEIAPEKFAGAIRLFNRIRQKTGDLYILKKAHPSRLPEAFFAQIIRASGLMDRERYLDLLESLDQILSREPTEPNHRVPLYVSGNMPHYAPFFALIEEAGGQVVWDDLCSGARTLRLKIPEELDPLEALSESYFNAPFCPTKVFELNARREVLMEEISRSGAKGVVFLFYKYCEPHSFDYPDLKKHFESRGLPTLLLEVEDPSQSREQLKIRLQAFVEMLA
jgi:benzoyl-CoA reductase/2-hydroxyglutaryl-CoA dehydratase subunit BcrC/BadD/HgdB